jgi:NTE family protein
MPFGTESREQGAALALSGGGFRAVLFHVGVLWRLNKMGVLPKLKRVSSVSGGSITSGLLAVKWPSLSFDGNVATNFVEQVASPLQDFCSRTVDVGSVIAGAINPFKSAGEELADEFRRRLGLGVSLQSLADDPAPRFVFNSTNYATGSSFRFSKPYCGDYRIGLIRRPGFDVALAVACSCAFPPLLAPIELPVRPDDFEKTEGADLWEKEDFRRRLLLADGGVYDNLGLETVWGRYETVLTSDAGKPFELDAGIASLAPKQLFRVMDIGLNQALALRKRMLIREYARGEAKGAYWGIATAIAAYGAEGTIPVSAAKIGELSSIRTRLDKFREQDQCELINWGYAVCDAAVRSHAPQLPAVKTSAALPFERYPLE